MTGGNGYDESGHTSNPRVWQLGISRAEYVAYYIHKATRPWGLRNPNFVSVEKLCGRYARLRLKREMGRLP